VYDEDAERPEGAPVAVIVFDPPVVSATTRLPSVKLQDPTAFARHEVVAKLPVVKAVVATVTVSAAPKPVKVKVLVPTSVSSGNPKLSEPDATLNETFGLMVKVLLTEFVPSDTTIVSAPPGRAGTATVVLNMPVEVVCRQAVAPLDVKMLLALPIPP